MLYIILLCFIVYFFFPVAPRGYIQNVNISLPPTVRDQSGRISKILQKGMSKTSGQVYVAQSRPSILDAPVSTSPIKQLILFLSVVTIKPPRVTTRRRFNTWL